MGICPVYIISREKSSQRCLSSHGNNAWICQVNISEELAQNNRYCGTTDKHFTIVLQHFAEKILAENAPKREWNDISDNRLYVWWKIPFHMTYENFKNANRNFWLSWTRPLLFITSEISRQSAWCTFSVHFKIFKMLFHSFFGIQNEKKKEKKTAPKITTPSKNLAMSSSHTIHCHKTVNICQQLSEVYNMSDICYCSYILAGPRGGLWLRSQVSDITHCGIHMWYIYMFAHVI